MSKKKTQKGQKTGRQKQQNPRQQKQGEQQKPFQTPYGQKKEW